MYGTAITVGAEVASGSHGYIVRFNLQANDVQSVTQVQAEATGPVFSDVIQSPVDLATLAGYLALASPPDIAWSFSGGNLDVFLKTSKFPFESTTALAIWWMKNALNVALVTEYLDVPDPARELARLMALFEAYSATGKRPKYNIEQLIDAQKVLIGL